MTHAVDSDDSACIAEQEVSSAAAINRLRSVRAVLFDLDDTLIPQEPVLAGAFRAVADAGERFGADPETFYNALIADARLGSARGGIINRAAESVGLNLSPEELALLVDAFRLWRPQEVHAYTGVVEALSRLRQIVPIGLITNGDPVVQAGKLARSGIWRLFGAVVFADELGREHRKPAPLAYQIAARALGTLPKECAFVGDRPEVDLTGAAKLGMVTVRVLTGEYRNDRSPIPVDLVLADAATAARVFSEQLAV